MPWQECSVASERAAFVRMAQEAEVPTAELYRHFGISRKTGHKWMARAASSEGLTDPSRFGWMRKWSSRSPSMAPSGGGGDGVSAAAGS